MRVWWTTTAIFGDLAGQVFENFGDTASNNNITICSQLCAGNWLQNEWPWMTLSGYFMSKFVFGPNFLIRAFKCKKIIQPLRFCHVLCTAQPSVIIRRSVSQPRYMYICSAAALFLCGSWASCSIWHHSIVYRNGEPCECFHMLLLCFSKVITRQ